MNAPLKSETVGHRLLLAANQQLESVFQRHTDACVALLISRNYHLLLQQQTCTTDRLNWMQKAKYWWQQYLSLSTGKQCGFMSTIGHSELLFKRIDMTVF